MSEDTSHRDVGRFDRWADSYHESPVQRFVFGPLQDHALDCLATISPSPGSLLDIGCGTGQLIGRAAARLGECRLVGIDASKDMVRVADSMRPAGLDATFLHAFAEALPFQDSAFDAVVTTMSFHHWVDQPAALHEVVRVLMPGGVFVLADALPHGLFRFVCAPPWHGRFHRLPELEEMLASAGLVLDSVSGVPGLGGFGGTVRVLTSRSAGTGDG